MTTAQDEARAVQRLARRRPRADHPMSRWTRESEEERAWRLIAAMDLLEDRELARRDADLLETADIVAGEVNSGQDLAAPLPDLAAAQFSSALARAESHDNRGQLFRRVRDEAVATTLVKIRSEPRTYRPDGEHGYFRDAAISCLPAHPEHEAAEKRLRRHAREVGREAFMATPEGRRAFGVSDTLVRGRGPLEVDAERRALSTGSSSAGAAVTPEYLNQQYALYRTAAPTVYEQTTKLVDPGHGMVVYLPAFNAPAEVAEQDAENTGVANVSPTATLLTADLVTLVGEVDISQALLDRAGPDITADQVIAAQLHEQLWTAVDAYTIGRMLASPGTVAGASSFTAAAMWQDIAKAKAQMRTAAGTVLQASHIFFPSAFADWATAQSDPAGRPLMLPTDGASLPISLAPDGGPPPGFTGGQILRTPVFANGSIPTTDSGAETQIIVAHMPEVYSQLSTPAVRVFPDTYAQDLSVVVQLVAYCGVIVRFPEAVQVISGAAYPASPTFV